MRRSKFQCSFLFSVFGVNFYSGSSSRAPKRKEKKDKKKGEDKYFSCWVLCVIEYSHSPSQ